MLSLFKKIDIHVVLMFKSVHWQMKMYFNIQLDWGEDLFGIFFFWKFCILQFIHRLLFFLKEIHHTFEMPYFIFVLIMAFTASIMFLNNNTFITTVFVNINSVMFLVKILSMKYFLMFS